MQNNGRKRWIAKVDFHTCQAFEVVICFDWIRQRMQPLRDVPVSQWAYTSKVEAQRDNIITINNCMVQQIMLCWLNNTHTFTGKHGSLHSPSCKMGLWNKDKNYLTFVSSWQQRLYWCWERETVKRHNYGTRPSLEQELINHDLLGGS